MVNFTRDGMLRRMFAVPMFMIALATCACESSSHGTNDSGLARLSGQAFYPPQVVATKGPVANAPYQVVDFEKSANKQVVATGVTDADGVYDVTIVQSKVVAVIVSGDVRVSGLISSDPNEAEKDLDIGKNFNEITDVACEAGVTSITDGSVSPDDFNDERIANLEAGSQLVNATTNINHFDPASVTAAAALVRQLTDDGAHAPRQ
ncbi:MAG: hypothetical protein U0136_19175 [Bdellovibrionota bacterium]